MPEGHSPRGRKTHRSGKRRNGIAIIVSFKQIYTRLPVKVKVFTKAVMVNPGDGLFAATYPGALRAYGRFAS